MPRATHREAGPRQVRRRDQEHRQASEQRQEVRLAWWGRRAGATSSARASYNTDPLPAPDNRLPCARPARDGHERKRGTGTAFDGHDGAAHHHYRAAFDCSTSHDCAAYGHDGAAHDYPTHHWNGAAFDGHCPSSYDSTAHGHDGAAHRRHPGAAFDGHDDHSDQQAKSGPSHPALRRRCDRAGRDRRAPGDAPGQPPPPASGCTIGLRCATGLSG
jgi:hypothetical protein